MILGIDIGTHWARAAYLNAMGEPRLVRLPDGSAALHALARQSLMGLEVGSLAAQALADNAEAEVGGLVYVLVPLAVTYPVEWPLLEPSVNYAPRWLTTLALPLADGRYHIIGGGRACLFSWNQWRPMSVAAVLQQRVVNHVVSLLKIAAGISLDKAFLGRVAH
jgi:hypothetical protein